jgi:hypothetical protein
VCSLPSACLISCLKVSPTFKAVGYNSFEVGRVEGEAIPSPANEEQAECRDCVGGVSGYEPDVRHDYDGDTLEDGDEQKELDEDFIYTDVGLEVDDAPQEQVRETSTLQSISS